MRITRLVLLLTAFLLVLAACGDDGDSSDAAETTAAAESEETTAAPETTTTTEAPATTTTAAPETTTTAAAAETTTTAAAPAGDAQERATAKATAAENVLPEEWMTSISTDFQVDSGTDDVFSVCTDDDQFDVADLDEATVAIATLMADGPPPAGSFFPGGSASVEARIFESSDVSAQAFEVLETVFGTEEGRQCVAEEFLDEMTQDIPADEADSVNFSLEEITVAGADVGVSIMIGMEVEGISFEFAIELAAAREGDCTIYSTFLSFGEPFDPAIRDALFSAAAGAF